MGASCCVPVCKGLMTRLYNDFFYDSTTDDCQGPGPDRGPDHGPDTAIQTQLGGPGVWPGLAPGSWVQGQGSHEVESIKDERLLHGPL